MLFNKLLEAANKNLNKVALNDYTYQDLFDKVENSSYSPICNSYDEQVIVDLIVAARENKPLVIMPKFKRDEVSIPNELPNGFGIILFSSGSTGPRKPIWLPAGMILENARCAILSQKLHSSDRILTVSSLNHTGGINVQTIPGLLMGAEVTCKSFNAFTFFKDLEGYTVTHLVPVMIDALMNVKTKVVPKSVRLVVAGSDCVSEEHVKFWQSKKTDFMINYGLTEAGPVICNHIFTPTESLEIFNYGVPLGDTFWSEYKIHDSELFLKGKNINSESWISTGDCVQQQDRWLIYAGRKSAGCKIIPKQY